MFTEEDVKNLQTFAKFVADRAQFDVDWSEAVMLAKFQVFFSQHIKKVNDHIMELRAVHTNSEEES